MKEESYQVVLEEGSRGEGGLIKIEEINKRECVHVLRKDEFSICARRLVMTVQFDEGEFYYCGRTKEE